MYPDENPSPRRSSSTERPTGSTGRAPGAGYSTGRPSYSSARPSYSGASQQRSSRPGTSGGAERASARPSSPARRPASRRFRRKRSGQPVIIAIAAVLVAGLGIFGAVKLFSSMEGMPVSGQVSASESASVSEPVGEPTDEPESEPAQPSIFDVKVAACYSDDAFVVDHLQVPSGVTTHPMLAAVTSDASANYSTEPVEVGSSGQGSIAQWKASNSDVVAWLKIPGTNINYPVVQGPSTSYYTERGYDKNYSKMGVIWAAGNCNFGSGSSSDLSFNTVLYGHNWTNWSATPRVTNPNDQMFGQLTSYQYMWFAQSHPYIWFSTENQEMLWQVFAVFFSDTGFRYINPDGGQDMLSGILGRSEFNIDVPVSTSDKILTLSTCTQRFGPSRQQRFVVCAKLVEGVSEEQPSVSMNPNPIRPSL